MEQENDILAVETSIFDQVETYQNCTVQILTNSITGEVSIGWWKNDTEGEIDG